MGTDGKGSNIYECQNYRSLQIESVRTLHSSLRTTKVKRRQHSKQPSLDRYRTYLYTKIFKNLLSDLIYFIGLEYPI
jgi:hypothetical protein